MNIERFIEARKQLGLAQSELCEGICTQATLSRFENNGQVPNLKILMKLCNRLNISLGDLFPKVGVKNPEAIEKMNQIEFWLITSEFEQACQLLATIDREQLDDDELLKVRYHYLEGFLLIYNEAATMDIMFVFDQIMTANLTKHMEIFHLLAFTGIGMLYMREKDQEKAEFYFQKVLERIYDYPHKTIEDTWRVLHIVFQAAVFYSEINELEISDALCHYAITICSDNHVTYYLARAAIQLAKNAIKQQAPTQQILELIYDARAYSKINRNTVALALLKEMEETVKQEEL